MPEASSKIVELITEWSLLNEEAADLEEQRDGYASSLKGVLRSMYGYSITDTKQHHAAYLRSNTRDLIICNKEALSLQLKEIKGKIRRLASRIENLKKQNESGG